MRVKQFFAPDANAGENSRCRQVAKDESMAGLTRALHLLPRRRLRRSVTGHVSRFDADYRRPGMPEAIEAKGLQLVSVPGDNYRLELPEYQLSYD